MLQLMVSEPWLQLMVALLIAGPTAGCISGIEDAGERTWQS